MPLLLHELVISSGNSGAAAATGIQKCTPHHVAIATVSHPGSAVQVTQLQQNLVSITNSPTTRLGSDNSRLAEALAGNSPYSYPANSTMHITPAIQVSYATPTYNAHTMSSPSKTTATYSSVQSSQRYNKGMAKQSYQVPQELLDHNYGAPPPQPAPHSPPVGTPHISVSSLSTGYKVQHVNTNISPSKNLLAHHRGGSETPRRSFAARQNRARGLAANVPLSLNMHNNGSVATSIPNSVPTQYIASLPLHRQQFMPQPKAPLFSSPVDLLSPTKSESSLNVLGADTDEESRLSDRGSSIGTSGEETETAPEGEGEDMLQSDDSITRCICDMTHDDGYMIQCDRCYVWQHVDCMEIDRNNIPDEYLCEACSPRRIDKMKAKNLQMRRMQEIKINLARVSSSDSDDNGPSNLKSRPMNNKALERKVLKKKKPKVERKEVKVPKKIMPPRKNSTPIASNTESLPNNNTPTSDVKETKIAKTRRRHSATPVNETIEDISAQVKNGDLQIWGQHFEVAVTNHYSPELRAKIQSIRINGISPEFLESANGASLESRCKVAPSRNLSSKFFESKILVATVDTKCGSAIVEYQGKYMLQSQWPSLMLPIWLQYMPYVVQYNMAKENVAMCIDARTYGNIARFARKSTKYNAKIRHIIKRGSVHLYLVACEDVKEGEEIILSLDSAVSINLNFKGKKRLSSGSNSQTDSPTSTADEQMNSSTDESPVLSPPRKNGHFQIKKSMKKVTPAIPLPLPIRQTRRTMSLSETFEELPVTPVSPPKPRRSSGSNKAASPAKTAVAVTPPAKPPPPPPAKVTRSSSGDEVVKEKIPEPVKEKSPAPSVPPQPSPETTNSNHRSVEKKDEHKMTREERKIAAIMKTFEMIEKVQQRRLENVKKRVGDERDDRTEANSSMEDESQYSTDDASKPSMGLKRKKRSSSYSSSQKLLESGSSPEMMRVTPESAPSGLNGPFRFPKTKKSMMTEWLNETVDGPVLPNNPVSGTEISGVKSCYMRSPSIPVRRPSGPTTAATTIANTGEMAGRSAKKRWLRQAIIDESEPSLTFCSSPNSRPDSPNGTGDYTTPLKKRRVARESMSSEHSNTPPTTPVHATMDDEKSSEEHNMKHYLKSEFIDEYEKGDLDKLHSDIKQESDFDQLSFDIDTVKTDADSKLNVKIEWNNCPAEVKKLVKAKKGCAKSKVKEKVILKPRHKKWESKSRSKVLATTPPTVARTRRGAKGKKGKRSQVAKKGRNPERKKKLNKSASSSESTACAIDISEAANPKTATSPAPVLEVRQLKRESPTEDDSGSLDARVANCSEDSNLSEKDAKSVVSDEKRESGSRPTPIKRKLSILEYRKRKSISLDADTPSKDESSLSQLKDSQSLSILSPHFKFDSPTPPHVDYSVAEDGNQSADEVELSVGEAVKHLSLQEALSPFSDDSSDSPPLPSVALANFLREDKEGDVKWNDAPTLLEQQRENLTARLRREFGLCIPDDKSKGSPTSTPVTTIPLLATTETDECTLRTEEASNLEGKAELDLDDLAGEVFAGQAVEEPQCSSLDRSECDKL